MTTDIKKSQIIKSLNNLHLKGINSIDEGLVKNASPLFSSSSAGAISIKNTGLYQVIDNMIKQLLEIKNRDKITRRIGVNIATDKYYTTSINRYSIKNREKQLYDVLKKVPQSTEPSDFDLSNNIDGSASSTNLKCQIVYNDDLRVGTDFFGTENVDLNDNNKNNNFISLQTPIKYDTNDVRISGEFKFVLRNSLSGSDTNSNDKYYTNLTDNCTEFLVQSTADDTAENLKNAINSKSIFQAVINTTSKTITVTQSNTDGIIIDNISFFTKGILLPIENFTSFRYTQFIANTESISITANRGYINPSNNRLAMLTAGYDQNGLPVKKYSEDSLFDFFGKMTYEFIKLNYNHIGNEQNHPGSFNQVNSSNNISNHHMNSVRNKVTTGSNKNIKKLDFIKQLQNLKKNGLFGSINKNSIINTTGGSNISESIITYTSAFQSGNNPPIPIEPTIIINVTVASKTSSHPYYSQSGSSSAYYLGGLESPTLNLPPGTYRFDQSDNTNQGHPLRFYTSADKSGSIYNTDVTTSEDDSPSISPGSSGAYTQIEITAATPTLYYQCSSHAYMGGDLTRNTEATKTFDVIVASKTSSHPYYNQGSSYAYYLGGLQSPTLNLPPGTYRFDQSDPSNSGTGTGNVSHPLLFYENVDKSGNTINVTTAGTLGNSGAYTQIVITETTTTPIYYQCSSHAYMGGNLTVDNGSNSTSNLDIVLYKGTTAVTFKMVSGNATTSSSTVTTREFNKGSDLSTTVTNLFNSINSYTDFTAINNSSSNQIIVRQNFNSTITDNNINNITGITVPIFSSNTISTSISPNTLSDIYKFIDNNLFTQTGTQIIPFQDNDTNSVGLYQLIDNLIFQIQIFKNKIKKREKFYRDKLKESNPNQDFISLDNIYKNNLKSKTSYCQTQGGLNSSLPKPSFLEIINNTDYTPSIEFKYSQDALFELCGRFLNELLKLNNGHSGFENIYPGFHSVVNLQATVSQHHLNSVIFS